jgi:hypothetical protein
VQQLHDMSWVQDPVSRTRSTLKTIELCLARHCEWLLAHEQPVFHLGSKDSVYGDVYLDQLIMRFQESDSESDDAATVTVTFDYMEAVSFPSAVEPMWEEVFDCPSHETSCHLGCWDGFLSTLSGNSNDSGWPTYTTILDQRCTLSLNRTTPLNISCNVTTTWCTLTPWQSSRHRLLGMIVIVSEYTTWNRLI